MFGGNHRVPEYNTFPVTDIIFAKVMLDGYGIVELNPNAGMLPENVNILNDVLPAVIVPLTFTLPLTSNAHDGMDLPIPTFPAALMRIHSVPPCMVENIHGAAELRVFVNPD